MRGRRGTPKADAADRAAAARRPSCKGPIAEFCPFCPIWTFCPFCPFALKSRSRTGLRLATATPALAALRLAHEHTRAEHARHARCTRARLVREAHAATRAHVKKFGWRARVTGHWLTVGRPAAGTSGSQMRCKHARHLRCSRGPCVTHTLCLPSTTVVVTVRRDTMKKTNDTMKKTENTMDDASECAPLVPAPPMRKSSLASPPRGRTRRALATARAAQATATALAIPRATCTRARDGNA